MSSHILRVGGTLLAGTAFSIGGLFFHPILPIGITLLTSGITMLTGETQQPANDILPSPIQEPHANHNPNTHDEHCEKNINVIFSNQTYVDNRHIGDNHEEIKKPPGLKRTLTI